MLKKLSAIILSLGLVFSLAACGGTKPAEGSTAASKTSAPDASSSATKEAENTASAETSAGLSVVTTTAAAAAETSAEVTPPAETASADEKIDLRHFTIRTNVDKSAPFKLAYPKFFQQKFGEALTLDKYPEKLVVLSTSSLYLLKHLNVQPIAVSRTVKNSRAADAYGSLPQIESGMNGVDTEAVIALQPDLVLMSSGMADKFGKMLTDLKIPVYYTSEGPMVTYDLNKEESLVLAEGFGGSVAKEDVARIYGEAEAQIKAYKDTHDALSMMILFGMDQSYQASSLSFCGSLLQRLGFINLTDKNEGPEVRVAPGSMEKVIAYNPQVLFLIAPPTGYDPAVLRQTFTDRIAAEKELWKNSAAVINDRIVALPGSYTTSQGLQIVHDIADLIDTLNTQLKD